MQVVGRKTCEALYWLVRTCKKIAISYTLTIWPRPGKGEKFYFWLFLKSLESQEHENDSNSTAEIRGWQEKSEIFCLLWLGFESENESNIQLTRENIRRTNLISVPR